MCSTLSSCRLYSWMRLIWLSKMVSGSTVWPVVRLEPVARSAPWRRAWPRGTPSRNAAIVGQRRSRRSSPRSVTHSSPMASVISWASAGFASSSQRRGVTPLVLLLNRSGNISAKSATTLRAQQLGVDGRHAVGAVGADDGEVGHAHLLDRAFLDQAHPRRRGPRRRESAPHIVEKPAVDLVDDLQVPGQDSSKSRPATFRAPRAAACGWCRPACAAVRSQASSQPRLRLSSRMRISSATAIAGCVSLSWMATLSGSAFQSDCVRRKRRTISASEHATRKYSWTKRKC